MPICASGLEAVRLVWQFGGPAYVFAPDGWVTRPLPQAGPLFYRDIMETVIMDHTSLDVAIDDEFRRWMLWVQHHRVYELGLSGPPTVIPADWRYQLLVGEAINDVRAYVHVAAARLRAQLWPPKPFDFTAMKAEFLRQQMIRGMQLPDPRSFIHITEVY
jgi:hypothetical protein